MLPLQNLVTSCVNIYLFIRPIFKANVYVNFVFTALAQLKERGSFTVRQSLYYYI